MYTAVQRGFLYDFVFHVCLLGIRLLGVHGTQDLLLGRDLFRFRIRFIGGSVIRQCLFCCCVCRCFCLLSLILIPPPRRVRFLVVRGKSQFANPVQMLEQMGTF